MLRHDLNTTLNQIYEILITLLNLTYQSKGSVSHIYPFLGKWPMKRCYMSHCFQHISFGVSFKHFCLVFVTLIMRNISRRIYLTNSFKSFFFCFVFLTPCHSIYKVSVLLLLFLLWLILPLSLLPLFLLLKNIIIIITIILMFSLFLLLLILLYLFDNIFSLHYCNSYQVNITIIVSMKVSKSRLYLYIFIIFFPLLLLNSLS